MRSARQSRGGEMSDRRFPTGSGALLRRRAGGRRGLVPLAAAVATLALAVGAASAVSRVSAGGAAGPQRGGTLRLLGTSDIFNLDTTSGYYTVLYILSRAFTRQLVTYPASPNFLKELQLAPDIATAVPSRG